MAIDSSVGPGWDGRAAKMSRSMVPFASLISTGLRLMSELRTLQRGPGPGPLGRLAGPCARPVGPRLRVGPADSDSGSERRCPAGAAGAAESLAPDRSMVGHGVPGTSLSGAGVPARPARGPGRAAPGPPAAAAVTAKSWAHGSISAAAASRSGSYKYAALKPTCYVKCV